MIKLIKPYISFEEVEKEFKDVFESGWFTKGKFVEEFRSEIKKYTGAKHAFLATSATTALTACLKILNVKEGDEVIVSDFSFPATVNVVEDVGATPIFADVSLETYNMLPEELEKKITKKTKAVIFVDALGNPSGIHEIKRICEKYNIFLIEDAACAIGSSDLGIKCGNIADLTCFSFHPRKLLTTGEGGAITTNNDEFAKMLDIKLNHGSIFENGKFDFVDYGYNYRLPELQAIMGIKQIKKIDEIVRERNKVRSYFIQALKGFSFVPQKVDQNVTYNVQSLVFVLPEAIERDSLIQKLKNSGVETTLGTYSLSNCNYYKNKYKNIQKNSSFLEKHSLTIPCYEDLNKEIIINSIKASL